MAVPSPFKAFWILPDCPTEDWVGSDGCAIAVDRGSTDIKILGTISKDYDSWPPSDMTMVKKGGYLFGSDSCVQNHRDVSKFPPESTSDMINFSRKWVNLRGTKKPHRISCTASQNFGLKIAYLHVQKLTGTKSTFVRMLSISARSVQGWMVVFLSDGGTTHHSPTKEKSVPSRHTSSMLLCLSVQRLLEV